MICLARGLDDHNPDLSAASRLIGDSIPPMRIMTVELRFRDRVQREHDNHYGGLAPGTTELSPGLLDHI